MLKILYYLLINLPLLINANCAANNFIYRKALNIEITNSFLKEYNCDCNNEPYKSNPPKFNINCSNYINFCNNSNISNVCNNYYISCMNTNSINYNASLYGECDICYLKNPGFSTGDIAWMLFSTTFVMLQTPATGFTQSGLVRRKNSLSLISQSFFGVVIGCILWYIIGYSLTFSEKSIGGIIGDHSNAFMNGISAYECLDNQTIPALLFATFQMTFALMVPVLITGSWAEKFNFFPACLFMIIWPFLVYYPTAHWIWGNGWLYTKALADNNIGILDFAGGIVIHTSSGISSLIVAIMLQKRKICKYKIKSNSSNIPLSMIGISLIWVGWYSFNGGSGLRANGQAIGALFVTQISACFSSITFIFLSYIYNNKVFLTDIASGALAGLAGITPASGYVHAWVGIPYGIIVGIASFYGSKFIKNRLNLDDVLDVTSLQAIPGSIGSIMIGFFATKTALPCDKSYYSTNIQCNMEINDDNMGIFYGGNGKLLGWQLFAVIIVSLWSGLFTYITLKIISLITNLDISPETEEIGLDINNHGEKAYDIDGKEDISSSEILVSRLCNAAVDNNIDEINYIINKLGVNPNNGDVDNRTIMHISSAFSDINTVKYLVNNFNVDLNQVDNWNSTPLREAIKFNRIDIIEYLKLNGAEINISNNDSSNFFDACYNNNISTIEYLLNLNFDINTVDYDGRTGLHIASCKNNISVCSLLIDNNADINIKDRWNNTPLDNAEKYKYKDIIDLFNNNFDNTKIIKNNNSCDNKIIKTNISTRELLYAAKIGDLSEIKRLDKKKVNLFNHDYDKRTALHLAATNNHLNIIKYLVSKKKCNINVQDNMNNTPLNDAINYNNKDIISFLKKNGGIISNNDIAINLCNAVLNNDIDFLLNKINNNIDINIADYDGRTPLHIACSLNKIEIVKLLLKNGADIKIKDRWCNTPVDDALMNNNKEIIDILLNKKKNELLIV